MLGLDYAGSSPGAAAVKGAGFGFVARYLSRYSSKTIKKPEYDDMTGNGVGVVLVFEDYANQALNGYNQGVSDAQVALQQANALGWPSNRPIHFAVDFDISPAQKPVAGEYMKGVASVIGLVRTAPYGGYWWVKYCFDNGLCGPFAWQAVAWSGGNIDSRATLFQQLGGTTVNGTSCDINRSLKDDFGQNNGGNMPTLLDEEGARILAAAVLERWPQPVPVPTPDDLMGHVGGDALEKLKEFWYSQEGLNANQWRSDIRAQAGSATDAQAKIDALTKALDKANATIKQLQDQNTSDTATGNAFIRWIGKLFGGSK